MRTSTRRWQSPTDSDYALTGGLYSAAARAHRPGDGGSSASATSTSTAASPAPLVGRQPFGGLQAVRRRLQGGRTGLPAAVHGPAGGHRKHHAPGIFSGSDHVRRQKSGTGGKGVRNKESGVRSQESGVRRNSQSKIRRTGVRGGAHARLERGGYRP